MSSIIKKQNIIILIIVLILAVLVYILKEKEKIKGTLNKDESSFAIPDTENITKIIIIDPQGKKAVLMRESASKWRVNNKYECRKDAIDILLQTLNTMTVKSPVSIAEKKTVEKRLAVNSKKVMIFKNNKKEPSKVFYVGGHTLDQKGTYMQIEGAKNPYILEIRGFYGFLSTRFFTDEYLWRNNRIYANKPNKIKEIKVIHNENKQKSFTIKQIEPYKFKLYNFKNEEITVFDSSKVQEYLLHFKLINGEQYINAPKKVDSLNSSIPLYVIIIKDDNSVTKIRAYRKEVKEGTTDIDGIPLKYDVDRMYAIINEQKEVMIIQYFVFDNITKPVDFFLLK